MHLGSFFQVVQWKTVSTTQREVQLRHKTKRFNYKFGGVSNKHHLICRVSTHIQYSYVYLICSRESVRRSGGKTAIYNKVEQRMKVWVGCTKEVIELSEQQLGGDNYYRVL